MPLYEYLCDACGERTEFLQTLKEKKKKKCPLCGKMKLQRQLGTGIGARFKGRGFYETDYKRKRDD